MAYRYKDYWFLGKNEALWARLLDNLGANWKYSREGMYPGGFTTRNHPRFVISSSDEIVPGVKQIYMDYIYTSKEHPITNNRKTAINKFYEKGNRFYAVSSFPFYAKDHEMVENILSDMFESTFSIKPNFFYDFRWIDGRKYTGFPGITNDGKFSIIGCDDIWDEMDMDRTLEAYINACNYEFETDGETFKSFLYDKKRRNLFR